MSSSSSDSSTRDSQIDLRRGLPEGLEMFEVIEDPRTGDATRHPFGSILFIALCAVLCGMDTCEDFVRFAKARRVWLEKWIALPGGIPCGNTFLRVFAAIDPQRFTEWMAASVSSVCPELAGQLVAIDGTTLRGSRKADERTVQIASAWACHNGLTLAQRAVDWNMPRKRAAASTPASITTKATAAPRNASAPSSAGSAGCPPRSAANGSG